MTSFDRSQRGPSTREGERIYAIGDVHGRLDLLGELVQLLEHDVEARGGCPTRVILLGDLIDRGPHSRQMLELAKGALLATDRVIILLGNHEELLLASASGNPAAQRTWIRNGGEATLESFGLDYREFTGTSAKEVARTIVDRVGEPTLTWLETLPLSYQSGDYFFCHAGVRPGVPLPGQKREDLLWIRDRFLESEQDHGAVIVHGHSETDEVIISHNRINLDTAAYRTGCLSCIGLQGAEQWLISTKSDRQLPQQTAILASKATRPLSASANGGAVAAVKGGLDRG